MKRSTKKKRKTSRPIAKLKPSFRPEELEVVTDQLFWVPTGDNEETSAELFVKEIKEAWATLTQRVDDFDDLAKRLRDTRRMLAYHVAITATDNLTHPKPNEIRAYARRIDRDLKSRKIVSANIAMSTKTIEKHLRAAFDELTQERNYEPSRLESATTLLSNAQRLLVYVVYKNLLVPTRERPWPTLATEQAGVIAERMRERGIEIGGNVERLFTDAVNAVRPSR